MRAVAFRALVNSVASFIVMLYVTNPWVLPRYCLCVRVLLFVRFLVVVGIVCQEKQNVGKVVKQFNLSQRFVDMAYAVFKQLDLDQNDVIDQK